mgnify:CR=1 FL=1
MKIAVPTRGERIDHHFGHCEVFTVFSVDDQKNITHIDLVPSPNGCGCKSNIASVLRAEGVELMLAGNMGAGAVNTLQNQSIQVVRGCQGNARVNVEAYLKGEVLDSGESCKTHDEHHQNPDHQHHHHDHHHGHHHDHGEGHTH